jgi:hypothetical protein
VDQTAISSEEAKEAKVDMAIPMDVKPAAMVEAPSNTITDKQ